MPSAGPASSSADAAFRIRRVDLPDEAAARREILSIGCDPAALPWLLPRARMRTLRIEGVPAFAANLLKQEALAVGADTVVHRGACTLTVERSDVLILATTGQVDQIARKLRIQVPTLRAVGRSLEAFLKDADAPGPRVFRARGREFAIGARTWIMGILNATPDSFSDGGLFDSPEAALRRALEMERQGADLVDVGGESTRPGHRPVSAQEEMDRVLPILRRIRQESSVALSIDTSKAEVARAAVAEGADVVNDVWGLKRDPAIAQVVAETGAGIVAMHNRGTEAPAAGAGPETPEGDRSGDILDTVLASLRESLALAAAAGIPEDRVAVDPGIGFGVPAVDSLRMIDGLPALRALGRPVLIGPSRKSFIGKVLDLPVDRRLLGTAAAVAYGIARGADFVRVHDVAEMREVVRMADALRASGLRDGRDR